MVAVYQESKPYTRPTRYGNYFNSFFPLDNSSNSVTDSFDIYAVKYDGTKDIVAKQTLNVFVPKTPEQFTYDNDGNLLSDGKFSYTWNGENRLISAVETDKQKIEFAYDYNGRRYERKSYSWNGADWMLASTIKYVYDGNNVIAEYDSANNLLKSYLWGEDVSGSLGGAGGVGGLLLVNDTAGVYLPYYDGNGNIMGYIDSSDGTSKASYEYNPFGKVICKYGSKSDDFSYQFSTKYYDADTGLLWYRYRAYIPEIARWSSRDPIGEIIYDENTGEQKFNLLYGFVNNDPVNAMDYLGLKWTITRDRRKSFAYAGRDDLEKDTIQELAVKLKYNVREATAWLRDEDGKIMTKDDLKTKCKFQIPNTVLLLLPELPDLYAHRGYFSILRTYTAISLREKLESIAAKYRAKKFNIEEYDFNLSSTSTSFSGNWPVHGFIAGGHGSGGYIQLSENIAISPASFFTSPAYKYGLVYAISCHAGAQDWHSKAAVGADVYVSPDTFTFPTVPAANPPNE